MFAPFSGSSERSRRAGGPFLAWLAVSAIVCSLALRAGQGPPSDVTALQIIVASSAEEAEQLRGQIKAGADFAALAREKSVDPTGRDGGHLGRLSVPSLRPELRDALQGTKPGQTTAVVRIPTGYAILRVTPDSEAPAPVDSTPSRTLAASATGATRDALPVVGLVEADLVFQSAAKPEGWAEDLQQICRIRTDSTSAMLQRLEGILGPSGSATDSSRATPEEVFQAKYALAQLYAYVGNMDKAVAWWREARKTADASIPDARAMMTETLGIALLHKSEMDNGVYRAPGDMCLFPPRTAKAFTNTAGAEEALGFFSSYLAEKPDDLEVKWLLNLASMTLGRYPGGVPKAHLIPESRFASSGLIGRFTDVASAAGLKVFSMAGGAVVDDFRGNGLLDVVTSSMDACEPLHVFRNNGDGTFAERSAQAGVSDQLGGLNLIQADYNNDGCMDLLVLRGGWEFPMRRSLLRNNCDGTFTDVTKQSGAGFTATSTQTAVWADIDNDGFLDLFVGNEDSPNQLYRNKGDGTFEDIASRAGVDTTIYTKAVVAADYDNDGFVDFYLSNFNGNNLLYHNNKNGTFTEVGKQAGVQAPWRSFAAWFFDYDNDGWPDLFVNSYYFSLEEPMRSYLGLPHGGETSKLYRNLGNGTFRDVTADAGLDKVWMPMAANFGDADSDGYLDMYLGDGQPVVCNAASARAAPEQGRPEGTCPQLIEWAAVRQRDGRVGHRRAAQGPRHRVRRSGSRRRRRHHRGSRRSGAGGSPRASAVRESRERQRLDQRAADWREEQSRRDRRADCGHGRRRDGWRPHDARPSSHRRQRRVVWREPHGAAHRARTVGSHRQPRRLVACHQFTAAFRRRREEPVSRDLRVRHRVPPRGA